MKNTGKKPEKKLWMRIVVLILTGVMVLGIAILPFLK